MATKLPEIKSPGAKSPLKPSPSMARSLATVRSPLKAPSPHEHVPPTPSRLTEEQKEKRSQTLHNIEKVTLTSSRHFLSLCAIAHGPSRGNRCRRLSRNLAPLGPTVQHLAHTNEPCRNEPSSKYTHTHTHNHTHPHSHARAHVNGHTSTEHAPLLQKSVTV